jgi:hypothetical protein
MIARHPRLLAALRAATIALCVALPAAFLSVEAPAVRAADMVTDSGPLKADRISFNGKSKVFTIYNGATKKDIPLDQVRSLEVNEAQAADIQSERNNLATKLESKKQEAQTVQEERDKLKKDLETLNTRSQKDIDDRDAKIGVLESEKRSLSDENARLKNAASVPAATATPAAFTVNCQPPTPAKAPGLVNVTGTVTNTRAGHCDKIIVEVTALDANDLPLAMATTFVSNVDAGATRTFATDVEVPDPAKAVRARAAVAEAD